MPLPGTAQRTLHIEDFAAEALVLKRGHTVITERITARFEGQWNGIYRVIPVNYRTDSGLNYKLILKVESATDGSGTALRYEVENESGNRKVKMWVPGAHNATKMVVLRYRVENMLRFFEEHDELYWNVTGFDWDVPIQHVSARVLLPAGASGLRVTSYTGTYGSRTSQATHTTNASTIEFEGGKLGYRENMSVVVGWNRGLVERPTALAQAGRTARANGVLLVPLVVLFLMYRLWLLHGRDPKRLPIAPAYEPPKDMTPAEAGTLIDMTPDLHDITATIVDLAVRGYLRIEERKDEQLFGLIENTGYTFQRTGKDETGLKPHESQLLHALFMAHDFVHDHQLKNRFYKDLPPIRESLLNSLVERGYYKKRPDQVRALWIVSGVIGAVAIGFLGAYLNSRAGIESPAPVIAALLSGVIVTVFGLLMPARTVYGARVQEQVLGFEEFLARVESDRFERVIKTPELFEKYLPFAMAFKVDSNWCRAFEGIYTEPPNWYTGSQRAGFSPITLNHSLARMATTTSAVMVSAPRSSSSSSGFSSGGGFSGGGFGGGGGGGF